MLGFEARAVGHLARPGGEGGAELARRTPREGGHVRDPAWHAHAWVVW